MIMSNGSTKIKMLECAQNFYALGVLNNVNG